MKTITESAIYSPHILPDGRYTLCDIGEYFFSLRIAEEELEHLSLTFGLPVPLLTTVLKVETNHSGFLLEEPYPSRPKILFEAHQFYKRTPFPVSKTRPDLSSPHWNRSLYRGGSLEWDRLQDAIVFDEKQALMSTSFGKGQVMGFNYALAGCDTIYQFVEQVYSGEFFHVLHVLNFIKNRGLLPFLKDLQWGKFAEGYNGKGHHKNAYASRLVKTYLREKYKWSKYA